MTRGLLKAKALLIDLDGTIVDPSAVFAEAVAAACSTVRITPNSSKNLGWEIARRLQRDHSIDNLFDNPGESLKAEFLATFLQNFYDLARHKTRLLPRVDKTLDELAERFLLGLITRRQVSQNSVRYELARLGIGKLFGAINTALDVEKPTPAPDALLKAARELAVPISSCVVVSDSGVDIQAGKRAGAKTVAVLSGLFKEEELREETPDLIVEDINRLPALLQAT